MTSKYTEALTKGARIVRSALLDRRPTVAYVGGWLGKHNLGDNALFAACQSLFPTASFVCFDGGRVTRGLFRVLPRLRAGVLGGGTLIGHKREWLEIARAFVALCPELIVFGTGVEEPSFWPGETTLDDWKPLLERCRFIGVRGPTSADLLVRSGLRNVQVVGDPVLTFAATEINPCPIPDSIGLNIGTSDGNVWGDENRICEETARLARMAREARWQVEWFVVWPKDLEITRRAAAASGTSQHINLICDDHRQFSTAVRRLTAFVGMKLHATVLATCALTPSIMLEYRPKCRDYMQSIGQEEFTFRTDTFRAETIWETVQGWNAHRREAALALSRAIEPIHARQQAMAAQVAGLIRTNLR